jgi:hypothetical protein
MTDTLGRFFAACGLPAKFTWGPEYWGSTYEDTSSSAGTEGARGRPPASEYMDPAEWEEEQANAKMEEEFRRMRADYNAGRRGKVV